VHEVANLARDSECRMYRERRSFVPVDSGREAPLTEIQFFDPVAKTKTICTVRLKQCVVSDYHPRTSLVAMPSAPFANAARSLVRENIGNDVIDGLNVSGTRETTTINPGAVGNSQALVSTREFWYSEELQTNLAVTRNDPRDGEQVVRLIDLSAAEPDARFFAIPAGYVVSDARVSSLSEK
jgi:hypothetical protein